MLEKRVDCVRTALQDEITKDAAQPDAVEGIQRSPLTATL